MHPAAAQYYCPGRKKEAQICPSSPGFQISVIGTSIRPVDRVRNLDVLPVSYFSLTPCISRTWSVHVLTLSNVLIDPVTANLTISSSPQWPPNWPPVSSFPSSSPSPCKVVFLKCRLILTLFRKSPSVAVSQGSYGSQDSSLFKQNRN